MIFKQLKASVWKDAKTVTAKQSQEQVHGSQVKPGLHFQVRLKN